MFLLAASSSAFTAVVLAVAAIGVAIGLAMGVGWRDVFRSEGGRFWIFHGEADTSPHRMPGSRFEERHVLDPPPEGGGRHE